MRTALKVLATGLSVSWIAGCIPAIPEPVTIVLVNSTSLDVTPRLYVSGSATSTDELFVGANLITDFTDRAFPELRAAESVTLTFDCDQAESIGVQDALLFDAVALVRTVSDDQIFRRQGVNLECGATLRFVYFVENDTFGVRVE